MPDRVSSFIQGTAEIRDLGYDPVCPVHWPSHIYNLT